MSREPAGEVEPSTGTRTARRGPLRSLSHCIVTTHWHDGEFRVFVEVFCDRDCLIDIVVLSNGLGNTIPKKMIPKPACLIILAASMIFSFGMPAPTSGGQFVFECDTEGV